MNRKNSSAKKADELIKKAEDRGKRKSLYFTIAVIILASIIAMSCVYLDYI